VSINLNKNLDARQHGFTPAYGRSLIILPGSLIRLLTFHAMLFSPTSKPSPASDLNDILPQLKKGAPVAYNPSAYEQLDLKIDERKLSAWRSKRNGSTYSLYVTIVICSIGAAVQD
jgi:hypothetical protein